MSESGDGVPGGACPAPRAPEARIQLAHGGGGRLQARLVEEVFLETFASQIPGARDDAALLELPAGRVAFTTDGFVVTPLEFPGGDIGRLAVCGTVNDLAVSGARPAYLSLGAILEEGLELETLRRLAASAARAAAEAGVEIVTGDTKVVDRGRGHGVFLTTAGVGVVPPGRFLGPAMIRPGDAVLVSGDIGRHGVAVLAAREGLGLEGQVESDCAPLGGLVEALLAACPGVHCLRDPTRGGLAASVLELSAAAGLDVVLDEPSIPISSPVRGVCELLGLDPMLVACEGRLVAFVPEEDAALALATLRSHPLGASAALIGEVEGGGRGRVSVRGALGVLRPLDLPAGEQLPRIC